MGESHSPSSLPLGSWSTNGGLVLNLAVTEHHNWAVFHLAVQRTDILGDKQTLSNDSVLWAWWLNTESAQGPQYQALPWEEYLCESKRSSWTADIVNILRKMGLILRHQHKPSVCHRARDSFHLTLNSQMEISAHEPWEIGPFKS